MGMLSTFFEKIGAAVLRVLEEMGGMLFFSLSAGCALFTPPLRVREFLKQMEFVGVKSLFVVLLTGCFTGMVMALQIYYGFRMFSAESLVGSTVTLAITRELGPVLTALMVTARAGSAMAAQLGAMRVSEQVDALYVMAVNPIQYLVTPRLLACVSMFPLLTVVANFIGVVGAYYIGVQMLQINEGIFIANIIQYCGLSDIYNGLLKSVVFGFLVAVICCYKGFYTRGGAEGVGRATTEAVVLSAVAILASDYILTALMF